jgi:hypothetical protein
LTDLPAFWICGDTRAGLYAAGASGSEAPLWTWDSSRAADLADERRLWFRALDEVKPITFSGASYVLVTSSGQGGVALVRRADGRVIFSAPLKNAHSADLLPGGWIVAAGSLGSDRMVMQHLAAGHVQEWHEIFPQPWSRGVVYEPARRRVWFCGASTVRVCAWDTSAEVPRCEALRILQLPCPQAHDMQPDRRDGGMIVTMDAMAAKVDPRTLAITPYALLAGQRHVKGVSVEERSGTVAYIHGHSGHWWSDYATFILPDGSRQQFRLPGRKLYKVRWDQSCWLE